MAHHTYSITFGTGKDKAVAKVRVVETASLFELADVLLTAIGFDLDHAFGFHSSLKSPYDRNMKREFTAFADQGEGRLESDTGVESTKVCDVFSEGEKMLFHFDYGDDWIFIVQCLSIEKTNSRKRKPEILEVVGIFPEQYPDYDEE
ncbi:IS1096 element passenger TnpR family protein [Rubritalea profundi]|uniref:Plasmid pRiA4b Orf3-like domain-containing protein n=1 Tax=Rubritalea profundi TaxID=1658618 RepID=A0A2S7U596_9BACT|nr:hypothetical protein [Rubritalea profundi]PQJ30175.1 hypothetical protein BSZ32_17990 [Rubritalea profundi]